jgi:hypothetical protein
MIRNTRDVVRTTGIALLERGRSKCRVSGSICPAEFHWSGPMVHQAGSLRLSFLVVRTLHETTINLQLQLGHKGDTLQLSSHLAFNA